MKCVFVLSVIYFVSLKTLTISFFFWGQKFHQNFVCLLISPFNTVSLIMFLPLRTYSVSGAPHWIFLINHLGLFTLFSHISPFGLWALLWQIFLTSPHSSSAWALVWFFFPSSPWLFNSVSYMFHFQELSLITQLLSLQDAACSDFQDAISSWLPEDTN